MKVLFLSLVFGFFIYWPAQAGLQAEPYAGYWSGTLAQDSSADIASKGLFYGAKLGLGDKTWKYGADFMMGSGAGNQGGSTGAYDFTAIGPFVGVILSKFFQLYASYFIKVTAKLQKDKNPENFTGSGYRIGLGGFGWGGQDWLGINVEYDARNYKKYNSVKLSKDLSEQAIGVSFSISFPSPGGGSGGPAPSPSGG